MNTLAPNAPEWHKNLPSAQDPFLHKADTVVHENLRDLPYMSPEQEALQFQGIIENFALDNHDTIAPHTVEPDIQQPQEIIEVKSGPKHRWTPERDYTPTPAAEIERRRAANMRMTFDLAHTLRDSHPELIKEANQAYHGLATEIILPPEEERPADYRGRHRRLGRFARLFSRSR